MIEFTVIQWYMILGAGDPIEVGPRKTKGCICEFSGIRVLQNNLLPNRWAREIRARNV